MDILLDCDGVLADFTTAFLAIGNTLAGTSYTVEDATEWDLALPGFEPYSRIIWDHVSAPGFARKLSPYPEAIEAVRVLRQLGRVRIVTTPIHSAEHLIRCRGETFHWDRLHWLYSHFDVQPCDVIFTAHKELVTGDVFVDDKLENVRDWIAVHGPKPHVRAFLWSQPYNAGFKSNHPKVLRTSSWQDVIAYVRKQTLEVV